MDDFLPLDETWLTHVPPPLSPEELRGLEKEVLIDPEIVSKTRHLFESLGIQFDGTDFEGSIARLLENVRTTRVAGILWAVTIWKDIWPVRDRLDN